MAIRQQAPGKVHSDKTGASGNQVQTHVGYLGSQLDPYCVAEGICSLVIAWERHLLELQRAEGRRLLQVGVPQVLRQDVHERLMDVFDNPVVLGIDVKTDVRDFG